MPGSFCIFGALATVVLLWPGYISFDALRQYYQAATHDYNNWHPVVMALWWSLLNTIHSGIELMFLFQVLMYWVALYVFSDALCEAGIPYAGYAALIGFCPFLILFSGVILKDTNLVVAWALAFAIVFRSSMQSTQRWRILWIFAVILCLTYGVLVRHNATIAFLPIAAFAVFTYWRRATLPVALTVSVVAMAVIVIPVGSAIERSVGTKQNSILSVIFLYDLTGIAVHGTDTVLPQYIRSNPDYSRDALVDVYSPDSCVSIMVKAVTPKRELRSRDAQWWANGPYLDTFLCAGMNAHVDEIRKAWMSAVFHHPLAYLTHRANVFRSFLRLGYVRPYGVYREDLPFPPGNSKPLGISIFRRAFMYSILATTVVIPVLYKPYFWLVLTFVLCTLIVNYQGDPRLRAAASTLILSSFLYLLPLFFVLPVAEFRYAYWAVFALTMAVVIIVLDCLHHRRILFPRRIVPAALLAMIMVTGLDVILCFL